MKRLNFALLGVGLLACAGACMAGQRIQTMFVKPGTNLSASVASAKVNGFVNEIHAWASDGMSTGKVAVTVQPASGVVAAYNIATNDIGPSLRWYPAVDATEVSGKALSSDPPRRYFLKGDTVTLTVTGIDVTNLTWNCSIKTSDE